MIPYIFLLTLITVALGLRQIIIGARKKTLERVHVLYGVSIANASMTILFAMAQSYWLPFGVNFVTAVLYFGAFEEDKKGDHRLQLLIMGILHLALFWGCVAANYLRPL